MSLRRTPARRRRRSRHKSAGGRQSADGLHEARICSRPSRCRSCLRRTRQTSDPGRIPDRWSESQDSCSMASIGTACVARSAIDGLRWDYGCTGKPQFPTNRELRRKTDAARHSVELCHRHPVRATPFAGIGRGRLIKVVAGFEWTDAARTNWMLTLVSYFCPDREETSHPPTAMTLNHVSSPYISVRETAVQL